MSYRNSILNAIKELEAVKNVFMMKDSLDKEDFLEEAFDEVIYNLDLAYQGTEYKSDEYQFLSTRHVEVMGE